MAYNELIRNFNQTREYLRDFFVYGFRKRLEFTEKSARTYDNEKRRIESWLGGYVKFKRDVEGKNLYISVDSRDILQNPLYQAFKSKTFTKNDIIMHFYIMDILPETEWMTATKLFEKIADNLAVLNDENMPFEESGFRKKLKEYEKIGLIIKEKRGRETYYIRNNSLQEPEKWEDGIAFFSEISPVGVVGSYLLDKYEELPNYFRLKHHYLLYALDSEILYQILHAMSSNQEVLLELTKKDVSGKWESDVVIPRKIYLSSRNGREYLLGYSRSEKGFCFYRLDHIRSVTILNQMFEPDDYEQGMKVFCKNLWGVSGNDGAETVHIEMDLFVDSKEYFILDRLQREKRGGSVEKIDETTYRFAADIYDPGEMTPWIRSFIGRIKDIRCSNVDFEKKIKNSIYNMIHMYIDEGGNE